MCSCNLKPSSVKVNKVTIDNFSDINYETAGDRPYFSNINELPIGFSLGDYNDYSSILYLIESANVAPFDDKHLHYFLTEEELKTSLETFINPTFTDPITRKIQYYPYERLVTDNYVLLFINKRINDSIGKNYQFDLRTYTLEEKMIANFPLAKWDDENQLYYGGWLLPNNLIKRAFDNGAVDYYQTKENGEIVKTES